MTDHAEPLPRALKILWEDAAPSRRSSGLTRERIVAAAVELADSEGLAALSMARLAERLGCGTMSLYRHVANKDELVTFMLSDRARSPAQKPRQRGLVWRPYRLVSRAVGCLPPPPLGAASRVGRTARGSRPIGVAECRARGPGRYRAGRARQAGRRHGGAALRARGGGPCDRGRPVAGPDYSGLLRRVLDADRFPALAAAVEAGAFDDADNDQLAEFRSGLEQLLDGIAARIEAVD